MRQGLLGKGAGYPKSKTYPERVNVDATGLQESLTNYPMRSVLTHD